MGEIDRRSRALKARADKNLAVIDRFVAANDWIGFLAKSADIRSNTSVCLQFTAPEIVGLSKDEQDAFAKGVASKLEKEGVALDIGAYRDAPPGLRIWAGATVEASDLEALMPWIAYAYEAQRATLAQAA